MNMQKGFTLIELMIVVAIIAILAAIAIPAYQDYVVRSQVTEGLSLADGSKTAVAEFYTNHGYPPATNASAGVASAASIGGNYVGSLTIGTGGLITAQYGTNGNAQFGAKANTNIVGKTLVLSPITSAGSIQWTCKAPATGGVLQKYLPSSCR